MSTSLRWISFLGLCAWLAYTLFLAGWTYLTADELVERVLRESLARHQPALTTGSGLSEITADIRASILQSARKERLDIDNGNIIEVSANRAVLSATVRWSQPLISYRGRNVLFVPLSIEHSVFP
jgi:hypothetical protein